MKSPRRLRARTLVLIVAGLLLAAWLAPPFFHAGRYRRLLQAGLESKLGHPVKLASVTFRLLPHPGFSIDNVVIEQDPGFGSEPLARVGRVECDLRWRSLWGSRLDCARIVLDHPALNIVRDEQGRWNIEDFFLRSRTVSRIRSGKARPHSPAGFELAVEDARLNFTIGLTKKAFAITNLSGSLALDPAAGSIHFDLTGTPVRTDRTFPAPGAVEVSGEWKPGNHLEGAFRARVRTAGSLLYGWIPVLTSRDPEIYGLVDATLFIRGTIDRAALTGRLRLDQLHRWESLPPVSSLPVEVTFNGSYDRVRRQLFVRSADASFGASHFHLAGMFSQIPGSLRLDLVLGIQESHLRDLMALAYRLSGRHAALGASGLVDGLLTIRGPWHQRRYAGFIGVHSLRLQDRPISIFIRRAGIRIDQQGAHLLPVRFSPAAHVECVAEGFLNPPLPTGTHETVVKIPVKTPHPASFVGHPLPRGEGLGMRGSPTQPESGRFELTISTERAPLHELIHLARALGVRSVRDVDAEGWARAILHFTGNAWPFTQPNVRAQADLLEARLLVPGLTEPVRLRRAHLQVRNRSIRVDPLIAQIGSVTFSGWLAHEGSRRNPWQFDARTPRIALEEASPWFTVLGHKRPLPILDLIPGLRSLVARRAAGRSIFASLNARGSFESPLVTFRSARLQNVRAMIALAGRRARVEDAIFRVAGGVGEGSARIDFKPHPPRISGKFTLSGARLGDLAWRFPPPLRRVRGTVFATGNFLARGLTQQEMGASLEGEAHIRLRQVTLGTFDPLQALARAGALGTPEPARGMRRVPSVALVLAISHQRVALAPTRMTFSGAVLNLTGDYGFNGMAHLDVRADLAHVRRRWINFVHDPASAPTANTIPDSPEAARVLPEHRDGTARQPAGVRDRVVVIHLAGPLNRLSVVRPAAAAIHR